MTMGKKPAKKPKAPPPARKERRVPAGEFKAKCLALLDEVKATGETLIITKRGRAVAKVCPLEEDPTLRSLIGSVIFQDDIVGPTGDVWDADTL
jgi:prevent-host-death family protein